MLKSFTTSLKKNMFPFNRTHFEICEWVYIVDLVPVGILKQIFQPGP